MATTNVPIEIVLQDPDNPIVPTPDPANPGESGENTNIAVPNTALGEGYTTKDGSSSDAGGFFSSSAGATIIPAVVLTLAIATIVALLIHKYRKNKKTGAKTTKKERLATAASTTVAVLAAVVLVGQLGMTTTNAATGSEDTELSTPDKIQIIANRYDDVTIVASAEAVSYASTDTTFGYKLFMSMAGDSGNLYLDGDSTNEYYFAPTTRAGLSNNSWGYSLDDGAEQAMPLSDNAIMAQQNTSAVEGDEFDVYYSMKADKDMPFGVYSGEIAYDIEGYNGFPSTLTTMQGMTSAICDAAYTPSGTETVVPTATLKDTRDNKTYEVAKLADGNCWMIQNLDLDLDSQTALTPENTHISSSWTPANSTINFEGSTTVTGWQNSDTAPYSADPGPLYIYSSGTTNQDDQYTSLADCQKDHPDCSAKNHVGNYYNWSAAVATNNTGSITAQYTNVETDICPAGWELPDGPNAEQMDYSDMGNLAASYDNITKKPINESCGGSCNYYGYVDGGFNTIRTAPLWLARSGRVYYGGSLSGVAEDGYYWSNTVNYREGAFHLYFSNSRITPAESGGRGLGFSVRCVAQ